jgi:myo-inositol 2-dehydrogenase / D-chiro-inositol 1-dehydrogenase
MPKSVQPSTSPVPSRRDFLKTSAAALSTAVAGTLSVSQSAHAAGSDILKVGLVGCGGRGSGAATNALSADKNAKLVAMADAFDDRLEGSLERLQKAKPDQVTVDADHRFTGFDACDKLVASGVDVVILATPPHFRPQHLKACVDAGKHVFCEKPVAVDGPGIRAVLAACEEAKQKNLSIVSGLCWRYHTAACETMNRIIDGAIGRIVTIQETYNCGPPWFRNRDREPQWTEMEYQMRNWYPFTWLSGDHNVEQHVHSLDKASWLMGDKPPLKAVGMGGRQVRSEETIGHMFDHHAVVYEYADGVRLYSFCRRQAGCKNETSDHFFGTDGHCNVLKNTIDGKNEWRYKGPKCNMYVAEHEALFTSIRDAKPINNGLYMAHSTMLAILGRMVTYTGKEITWEQAINSEESLSPSEYTWDAAPPIVPDENGAYPLAIPGVTPFA